jgi:hypothetical protein
MIGQAALAFFVSFAVAIVGGVIAAVISRSVGRSDAELDGDILKISPNRTATWIVVIIGIGIAAFAAAMIVIQQDVIWFLLGLFGLVIAGFMALSLSPAHDVIWTYDIIKGPCQLFGPSLGLRRATLRWDELVKIGKTASGYWFIEDHNGQRIYWSYLYSGHPMFLMQIRMTRSDIDVPEDLRG